MALTTTQVNQAFLATLGRPAEGSAATWGSTSLSLGALSDSIFIAENTEDFVESLYTEILGRASDAEGKAFWNSLLATTSKEAVLAQFKAAVIAAGQADPSNADYQSFIAQNKAFVQALYTNLLGRDDAKTADAEGVDFWANALATGMSRGDLISAFVSAALSDPNSDDAQTLNAKLSVADAYSAAFKDFGKDVTADEKKAAYAQLVEQMKEVVAGSTVEEFQDAINQFKGQNQDRKTDVFTKGEDDLDASESTAATTFRGTINISNPDKSTIESGDAATGNSEYAAANTLIVDVKSDGKEKDFNFATETAGVKVSNVNNLTINNGTADVTLNLAGGDNYTGKVAITGKGDRADVTVAQDVASLNVSTSGTKKAYADTTVAANATLGAFEGSAAKDTLTISGNIAKSINTGDGKDEVTLEATAKVFEKATISLGGGDDTLTINTSDIGNYNADGTIAAEDLKASVTIDGGAGTKDKLVLNNSDISAGVKAITGVEFIDSTLGAISAAAADGLKTTVSGDLTIKANYKEVKSINLKDIKSFTNDSKVETGSLSLSGITYENITLSSNIKENIVVAAHTAASPKNYAEINKFGEGDTIKVGALSIAATQVNNKALDLTRYADVKAELAKTSANVLAINDVNGKKAYIWQVLDSTDARLVAIVDKKLKVDTGSFVYDDGKGGGEDPVVVPGKAVDFTTGSSSTLNLAADSYNNFTIANQKNIFVNGIDDALTISGAKTAELVEAFITNSGGTVDAETAGNVEAQVKVYLGGSKNDAGKLTAGTGALDFAAATKENDAIAKGASSLYANVSGEAITLKDAKLFSADGKLKLDLSLVNADIKIGKTAIDQATIDLTTLVTGEDANDKVAVSGGATTNQVVGTKAADTITLAKNATDAEITVDFGADSVADVLDAKAAFISGAGTALKDVVLTSNAGSGDKVVLGAAGSLDGGLQKVGAAQTWNSSGLEATLELILAEVNGGSGVAKSVVVGKIEGATDVNAKYNGTYVIYNKSGDATLTDNDDIVVFLGNVDLAKVSLDNSIAASATGIVIA